MHRPVQRNTSPNPKFYPWFNPELDLLFERTVNMAPDRIWRRTQ